MKETLTLDDFAEVMNKRMKDCVLDKIDLLTARNELLEYLAPNGLAPQPWYKRWASNLGDWLIKLGIKLGGGYDYD